MARFRPHPNALRNTLAIVERCRFQPRQARRAISALSGTARRVEPALVFADARLRGAENATVTRSRSRWNATRIRARHHRAARLRRLLPRRLGHRAESRSAWASRPRPRLRGELRGVSYALGITAVDPIGGNLLFERFLTESATSPRHRHRLRPPRPRESHPVRLRALRPRPRGDGRRNHHLPHALGDPRRRQSARPLTRPVDVIRKNTTRANRSPARWARTTPNPRIRCPHPSCAGAIPIPGRIFACRGSRLGSGDGSQSTAPAGPLAISPSMGKSPLHRSSLPRLRGASAPRVGAPAGAPWHRRTVPAERGCTTASRSDVCERAGDGCEALATTTDLVPRILAAIRSRTCAGRLAGRSARCCSRCAGGSMGFRGTWGFIRAGWSSRAILLVQVAPVGSGPRCATGPWCSGIRTISAIWV